MARGIGIQEFLLFWVIHVYGTGFWRLVRSSGDSLTKTLRVDETHCSISISTDSKEGQEANDLMLP